MSEEKATGETAGRFHVVGTEKGGCNLFMLLLFLIRFIFQKVQNKRE